MRLSINVLRYLDLLWIKIDNICRTNLLGKYVPTNCDQDCVNSVHLIGSRDRDGNINLKEIGGLGRFHIIPNPYKAVEILYRKRSLLLTHNLETCIPGATVLELCNTPDFPKYQIFIDLLKPDVNEVVLKNYFSKYRGNTEHWGRLEVILAVIGDIDLTTLIKSCYIY